MAGKTLDEAAAERLAAAVEVDGIAIEGVDASSLDDFDFLEAVAALSDPDAEDGEKLRALAAIAPSVLGRAQWRRVKAELRERHGGRLTAEVATGFIFALLGRINAKN